MKRFCLIALMALAAAGALACEPDVETFVRELPVVDLHNDRSFFLTARGIPWPDCRRTQVCRDRYAAGRQRYFFSLFRPPLPLAAGRFGLSRRQVGWLNEISHFAYLKRAIADLKRATGLAVSRDPEDLSGARNVLFLGVEGAFLLDRGQKPGPGELEAMARELRGLGVSYVGLVWSNPNPYAGVAGEAAGLTPLGRPQVRIFIPHRQLVDI